MSDLNDGKTFYNKTKDVLLTLSDDNYSAYLTIDSPNGIVDENVIMELLSQAGITNGFEEAARYNRVHNNVKEIGKPFLIARGTNPEAKIEIKFLFDRSNCFQPDESYDVFEMSKFTQVKKGNVLARLNIESGNSTGRDLFGNEVATSGSSTVNPQELFGENIHYDENSQQLIANKSGYPYVDFQDRLQLKTDFYINENVANAELRLSGDLVINGDVNSSKITIDGSLTIYGNVKECLSHGIIVDGDLAVDDAYRARLICSGKFNFHNTLKDCMVFADSDIIGDEESILTGGLTQSSTSIKLCIVGSVEQHLAEIEIGFSPFIKEKIKLLADKLDSIEDVPEGRETEISELRENISKLEEAYTKKVDQFFEPPVTDHKITISQDVYPETRFRIFDNTHLVIDEKTAVTFAMVDRNIVINEVDKNE